MRTLHDMRDLVDIYYSAPNEKITYDWDKAKISVWQPDEQREMQLSFCGSSRPDGEDPGKLSFIASYKDELGQHCVLKAFNKVIDKIIDSRFDMAIDWEQVFIEQLVEMRKK